MLRGKLCPANFQQAPHFVFEFDNVVTFFDEIVLMEDVTKKMSVIKFVKNWTVYFSRQRLEPVLVVAPERDIESEDILDLAVVNRAKTNPCPSCSETMQKSCFAFFRTAFE